MRKFLIFISLSFSMLSIVAMTVMMFLPEMVGSLSDKIAVTLAIVSLLFTVLLGLDASISRIESVLLSITLGFVLLALAATAAFMFSPEMLVDMNTKVVSILSILGAFFGVLLWMDQATLDEAELYA